MTLSSEHCLAVVSMEAAWSSAGVHIGGDAADGLMQAAERAWRQGTKHKATHQFVEVLYACNQPVQLTFSWAARVVDLSAVAEPLAAALEYAQNLLASGQAHLVIFAAAAGADAIDVALRPAGMGFDRNVHGWSLGSGAGAVGLQLPATAQAEEQPVYGLIRACVNVEGDAAEGNVLPVAPSLEGVRGVCRQALTEAGISAQQVGYMDAFASGVDALDGVEIAGLCQVYRNPEAGLTTALGSAQAELGYLGAAAGLAGLIHACECLSERILPAAFGWEAPKLPALWKSAPFYIPSYSKTWFSPESGSSRLAGVNVVGQRGSFSHLIVEEASQFALLNNHALQENGLYLLPLVADDLPGLLSRVGTLQRELQYAHDLPSFMAEAYLTAQDDPESRYALSLLGHSQAELVREMDLALKALPEAFAAGGEWQTPLGSYFTAQPVGKQGGVALVYPGAFNSYPWVGKDLFRLFPWLHTRSYGRTNDLGRVIRDEQLYPRSLAVPTKEEQAAQEAALLADPIAMLTSGTAIAILFTYILEQGFDLHPSAAFGYSLGENSMMYASQIWQEGDGVTEMLEQSPVFLSQLAGPQNAIRADWGLPEREQADGVEPFWNNYILMTSWEAVQPVLAAEEHVYLTHINAPRQVVIGGDPAACKRVIAALRCPSLRAPFDYALHCAPTRAAYSGLKQLHNWPVECIPAVKLYSAADNQPIPLKMGAGGGEEISEKIAHMLTSALDFPALARKVYADGARVFIEVGAGSNCTRWVDESLKGQPHAALSINRRGTDDATSLVRLMARLFSQRVPVNFAALYKLPQGQEND